MRSLGAYPGVHRGGTQRIVGEVYAVDAAGLALLDRFDGHPHHYRRERLPVVACERRMHAWTYLLPCSKYLREYPRPVVPEGDWRGHVTAQHRRSA